MSSKAMLLAALVAGAAATGVVVLPATVTA